MKKIIALCLLAGMALGASPIIIENDTLLYPDFATKTYVQENGGSATLDDVLSNGSTSANDITLTGGGQFIGDGSGLTGITASSTNVGLNAVCSITQPSGYVVYYDDLADADGDFGDGCTLHILRTFESTNDIYSFTGNDSVIDGGGVPFTMTHTSFSDPAHFSVNGTNVVIRNLRMLDVTTTNYQFDANSYALEINDVVTGLVENCFVQQHSLQAVTSAAGTPKTFVAVNNAMDIVVRGGAFGQYAGNSGNTQPCTIFVNHTTTNNIIFEGTAFYNNEDALFPLLGNAEVSLIDGVTFQNCSYNGDAFNTNSGWEEKKINTLSTNDVRAIAFMGTEDLFVEGDTTTDQKEYDRAGTVYFETLPLYVAGNNEYKVQKPYTLIKNLNDSYFSYLLEEQVFDYQNDTAAYVLRHSRVMAMNANNYGYHSFLIGAVGSSPNITVISNQGAIQPSKNKSFYTTFARSNGTVDTEYGDPAIPTANNKNLIFTLSGAESCAEGDVLKIGDFWCTIDAAVSSDTDFIIRDFYNDSGTWPTASAGVSNVTTSTDITSTFSSDNIDNTKETGIFISSEGLNYFNRYQEMTEIKMSVISTD